MFKGDILNKSFLEALAVMGHRDILMVVDAGFPVPETGCRKVELAITRDLPDIETTLKLLVNNFMYEEFYVSKEQKEFNGPLYSKVEKIITSCPIRLIPHDEIMYSYVHKAKVIIRTGAFDPWGNMVFVSGVDAPKWFENEDIIVPDFYKDRVPRK